MATTHILQPCSKCEAILIESPLLLDDSLWDLTEIGKGGNGRVFLARCSATGCEHAAKFLTTGSARELNILRSHGLTSCSHFPQIICTGYSTHRTACFPHFPNGMFVVVQELLDHDLWQTIYEPLRTPPVCFLKHMGWQVMCALSDLEDRGLRHGDVKPKNIMIKYSTDAKGVVKLIDMGNAYRVQDSWQPGATVPYRAPENVLGRWNVSDSSDVFAVGLVLAEAYFRAPVFPSDLIDAYAHRSTSSAEQWRGTQLYHLVFLASIISGREVWTGKIVRRYFGNFSKECVRRLILRYFEDAERQIFLALSKFRELAVREPALYGFVKTLLADCDNRPSVKKACGHPWFHEKSPGNVMPSAYPTEPIASIESVHQCDE